MKLDDLTYEIKPLTNSEGFEHVVSQLVADASETGPTYGPVTQGGIGSHFPLK